MAKMKKKKGYQDSNKLKIAVAILAGVIILGAIIFFVARASLDGQQSLVTIGMYDEDRVKIGETASLSIVDDTPGVTYIDFTVMLENIGETPLSCKITSATPSALQSALDINQVKTLVGDGMVAWTSDLIPVAQFEDDSETTFTATILCSYNDGSEMVDLPSKVGSIDVLIQAETGNPDFIVTIGIGGVEEEFCGDETCQSSENPTTCPQDCAISAYVSYRTSDVSYPSGGAVAYSNSCGGELVAYGDKGTASWKCGDAGTTEMISEQAPGNVKLCTRSGYINRLYVTKIGATNSRYYEIGDPDASDVSTDPVSYDSAKEIPC